MGVVGACCSLHLVGFNTQKASGRKSTVAANAWLMTHLTPTSCNAVNPTHLDLLTGLNQQLLQITHLHLFK